MSEGPPNSAHPPARPTEALRERLERAALPGEERREILAILDAVETEEDRLREKEAQIRTIMNTTVDGIITIDEQGIVLSFNPAAEKIFGYTPEEVIGRPVGKLMPDAHRRRHQDYIEDYLETGHARVIGIGRETVAIKKNGGEFPIDLSVSEVVVNQRRFFTGIVRDISERKRAESAIVGVGEAVAKDIGQELHDVLGQQLTGITLLSKTVENKLAESNPALQAEAKSITRLAREAVQEAKRLSQGLYPTVLENHGIGSALEQLANNAERLYGVTCSFLGTQDLRVADRSAELNLYRIAQEAVNNAIKHGKAGKITVELNSLGDFLRLTVTDNGIGIPDDPAARGGMGLMIMQYRANSLRAALNIRKGKNAGTVVECTLPRRTGDSS